MISFSHSIHDLEINVFNHMKYNMSQHAGRFCLCCGPLCYWKVIFNYFCINLMGTLLWSTTIIILTILEVLTYVRFFPRCARRRMRCSVPTRWQSNEEPAWWSKSSNSLNFKQLLGRAGYELWLKDQCKNCFPLELCTLLQKLSQCSPKSKVYLYTLR